VSWFADLFREGRDVPPDRAAGLVLFLASGRGDALSGRFIDACDDYVALARRADQIVYNDLYALRLRPLD
jgi:hypothetical protein